MIPPDLAIRLLRAKVGELEARVTANWDQDPPDETAVLTADIALVASILADLMERLEAERG